MVSTLKGDMVVRSTIVACFGTCGASVLEATLLSTLKGGVGVSNVVLAYVRSCNKFFELLVGKDVTGRVQSSKMSSFVLGM